jgi:chloramphenicol 3-O phosphotransferase
MTLPSGGSIILLNGASSAGKSTLCRAVQARIELPFLQFSLDFFLFRSEVLPKRREQSGPFAWAEMRPKVFDGFHRCLAALADAGNGVVADCVVETRDQLDGLVRSLASHDVFFVGVHCPLAELERREAQRGDRRIGDARRDFETVHTFSDYDLEVDSTDSPERNAERVVAAWAKRRRPGVFARLAEDRQVRATAE